MADVKAYIQKEMERFQEELFDFLRIPSVSARSEHASDTQAAARWPSRILSDRARWRLKATKAAAPSEGECPA